MKNRSPILVTLLAACIVIASCSSTGNYLSALEPRFDGDFSDQQAEFDGTIKVVSYNISFARNIDRAIYELSEFDELKDADIVLLQEMDESGTEAIAQALGYNFVYYPASVLDRHDKNFGNAILSKWPVDAAEKVILPHKSPRNQQIRIAVKAVVIIENMEILTYSVHTETVWLGPQKRHAQIDALIKNIDTSYMFIVIGGDFNTLTPKSVQDLAQSFAAIGMERATKGVGYTAKYGPLEFVLDHIFTRGMDVLEAGRSDKAKASDHLPIWVELTPRDVAQP
jgi:endonuclease/exonuclease/phosphatase family metal-dependent hydrolase